MTIQRFNRILASTAALTMAVVMLAYFPYHSDVAYAQNTCTALSSFNALDFVKLGGNPATMASANGQTFTDIGTRLSLPSLVGINLNVKYVWDGSGNNYITTNNQLYQVAGGYNTASTGIGIFQGDLIFQFSQPVGFQVTFGPNFHPGEINEVITALAGTLTQGGVSLIYTANSARNPSTTANITANPAVAWKSSNTAATYTVSVDGTASDANSFMAFALATCLDGIPTYRYVKLEALSEAHGNPWASAAEVNVLDNNSQPLARTGWTVTADSQEIVGENGRASNAIDGNNSTYWLTEWSQRTPPHPHWLVIDMGTPRPVGGFRYLTRQNNSNTQMAGYRFYVSNDGVNWEQPVAQGTFPATSTEQTVRFASGSGVDTSRVYNLVTQTGSNLCVDVPNGSLANGVQLQQWSCNNNSAQAFQFSAVAGKTGVYTVRNQNSGKCLDVSGSSLSDLAVVIQWGCSGTLNQQWKLVDKGGGIYQFVAEHSGKCLDVLNASSTAGAKLQQYTCNTTVAQLFKVAPSNIAPPTPTNTPTPTQTAVPTDPCLLTNNLALGRVATASSSYSSSYAPNLANDGNGGTRWASNERIDPQWLQIDLGTTYAINRVVLNWEAAYAMAYQIQLSNDGVNWTTIFSTATENGGTDDLTNLSGSGRYIRMYGTQRFSGSNWGYSLWEFQVYGKPPSCLTPTPTNTPVPPTPTATQTGTSSTAPITWVKKSQVTTTTPWHADMDGNVAIIGSEGNSGPGQAYIARYNGTSWVLEQTLTASDRMNDDYFGESVAISGNFAFVGAFGADAVGMNSGAVYVFKYNGASWVQTQKLLGSGITAHDWFGGSVAVSGNVALIGMSGDDDLGTDSGSIYVYRYNGSSWVQSQKITESGGAAGNQFGEEVNLSGTAALFGVRLKSDSGTQSGTAYVYRDNGSTFALEQKLDATGEAAGDYFGVSAAIEGNLALIGSMKNKSFVFRYNGTSWVQEQKLDPGGLVATDNFGTYGADIFGNVAVVAASGDTTAGASRGAAYIFRYNGTAWVKEQKLLANTTNDWYFPQGVAVSNDTLLLTNYNDTTYFFVPGAAAALRAWEDNNGNGVQDNDEPGLANVTVELLRNDGSQQQTTTTDAGGTAQFNGLVPGDYSLRFTGPDGYQFTLRDRGNNDSLDSDADPATGRTPIMTLTANANLPQWAAGFFRPVTIGDRVWEDVNGNGVQDGGEPGLAGVTVQLFDSQNTLIATTTTGITGDYHFNGLPPGDYYLLVIPPTLP